MTNGTANVVNGQIEFTPDANYFGPASVTYTVNDGTVDSNEATLSINVLPVNDAPIAADDAASTMQNQILLVDVLANDLDLDGDSLSVIIEAVSGGVAQVVDNQIQFTPDANFVGQASVNYRSSDGSLESNVATVLIDIQSGVNPVVSVANGQLSVLATEAAEKITIRPRGNGTSFRIRVEDKVTGEVFEQDFPSSEVKSIAVFASGGDDEVNVSSSIMLPSMLNGGLGDDALRGGSGDDELHGGEGTDLLVGRDGYDILQGDDGADEFRGGKGDDDLAGNAGNDNLRGGEGADTLEGGVGDDELNGNTGQDSLLGGAGSDMLRGGDDADSLLGGPDHDLLVGGPGDDILSGGEGDDIVRGGEGNDTLEGGIGDDTLPGGNGTDTICGGDGVDNLRGGNDDDTLEGGDGHDDLRGGAGDDTLRGGANNDNLKGGGGADLLYGETGSDHLAGGDGNDVLFGQEDDDVLLGGQGDDALIGGEGNDLLNGAKGNNVLIGRNGSDDLRGGSDDDLLIGGNWSYQTQLPAIRSVVSTWSDSNSTYEERVNQLGEGVGESNQFSISVDTVFNDGATDILRGNAGRDWFWGDENEDDIRRAVDEALNDLLP